MLGPVVKIDHVFSCNPGVIKNQQAPRSLNQYPDTVCAKLPLTAARLFYTNVPIISTVMVITVGSLEKKIILVYTRPQYNIKEMSTLRAKKDVV